MKRFLLILTLFFSFVTACSGPAGEGDTPAVSPSPADGPADTPATALLTHVDAGYFFRYPVDQHAVVSGRSLCLSPYMGHEPPGPCHAAAVFIDLEDAAGRSAAEVADDLVASAAEVVPAAEIERATLVVGGEEAIALDGLPGVSSSRQVLVVHQDRLFRLTFVPWDRENVPDFARLENLYETIISSFGFIP